MKTIPTPKTLRDFANIPFASIDPDKACLVLIDMQNEYVDGALPLPDARDAIASAKRILTFFRAADAPIIHVVHNGAPGKGLFDPETENVAIPTALEPAEGEPVVIKGLPNSFAGTNLDEQLANTGRKQLVIVGFMTHMCVESTARMASEKGFEVIVIADACATRDLPHPALAGTILSAAEVHSNALAAISDRFATVLHSTEILQGG